MLESAGMLFVQSLKKIRVKKMSRKKLKEIKNRVKNIRGVKKIR